MSKQPFTHLGSVGQARVVDVTAQTPTIREAMTAVSVAKLVVGTGFVTARSQPSA